MNTNSYFIEKKENNIQRLNSDHIISKEKDKNKEKYENEEEIRDNPYNESESSREDYLPINDDLFNERYSVIKGMSLAFVFFSVIIYSLLYMLAPEKSANYIFEGNYNSTLFNNTLCEKGIINNIFYKLDTINIRENMIIMNISLNCLLDNDDNINNNNYLGVIIMHSKETKLINNILIENNEISKEVEDIKDIYDDYKINDFPFWLYLYKKDNNDNYDIRNITSDDLKNFF